MSAGGALWPVIKSANSETREILLFAVKEHGFLGLGGLAPSRSTFCESKSLGIILYHFAHFIQLEVGNLVRHPHVEDTTVVFRLKREGSAKFRWFCPSQARH